MEYVSEPRESSTDQKQWILNLYNIHHGDHQHLLAATLMTL